MSSPEQAKAGNKTAATTSAHTLEELPNLGVPDGCTLEQLPMGSAASPADPGAQLFVVAPNKAVANVNSILANARPGVPDVCTLEQLPLGSVASPADPGAQPSVEAPNKAVANANGMLTGPRPAVLTVRNAAADFIRDRLQEAQPHNPYRYALCETHAAEQLSTHACKAAGAWTGQLLTFMRRVVAFGHHQHYAAVCRFHTRCP